MYLCSYIYYVKSQIKDFVSDQNMGWPYTYDHSVILFPHKTTLYLSVAAAWSVPYM